MLPPQQQKVASGNNFAFSDQSHEEKNTVDHSGEEDYKAWAERIKVQHDSFGKPKDGNFGAWTRRIPKNNRLNDDHDDDDDDNSSTLSTESWNGTGSYSARAQRIAMYRQEMLDMVQGMPETAYELSLRDIVETPRNLIPLQETIQDESLERCNDEDESKETNNKEKNDEKKKKTKKDKKGFKMMFWNGRIMAGSLLLKMLMPRIPSIMSGRKSGENSGTCAKVSPKPVLGDEEKSGSEKSTDREWWNAEFEQTTSSRGSGSSGHGDGRRKRKVKGCYPFF